VLAGVDHAVRDLAIGQMSGLQNFLFHSQISPLTTVTHESVLLNIRGAGPLRDTKPEQIQRFHEGFSAHCGEFLLTVIGDNKR
jgi:hypothetical protein